MHIEQGKKKKKKKERERKERGKREMVHQKEFPR